MKINPLQIPESASKIDSVMKTYRFLPLLLSAGAVFAGSLNLNAATSDPVGATSISLPAGLHVLSAQFVSSVEFQGPASSITTDTINVASGDLSAYGTGEFFVEIKSGVFEGLMGTITASTSSSVTVDADLSGLAGDETFCIRPHQKLSQILGDINLGGAFESLVIFFDNIGNEIQLGNTTSSGTWQNVLTGDFVDPIIFPGKGFALFLSNPATLISYGAVKTGSTLIPIPGGFVPSVFGALNPVATTTLLNSGIGGAITADQDVVIILAPDGTDSQYFYSSSAGEFQNILTGDPADNTPITPGMGVFVAAGTDGLADIPVVYP